MANEVYARLADALDRLPNGFARTESGVECRLLAKIFSPEEAAIAAELTADMEPLEDIAARTGGDKSALGRQLMALARRQLVWGGRIEGKTRFRLAPFIVGIFEAQHDMDHEFAHLFEHYMAEGGAEGMMKMSPAIHRVVPSTKATRPEWILPYDDVRRIMENAKTFKVNDCICRVEREHVGRECDYPLRNCLIFTHSERAPEPNDISKEEALAILEESAKLGLVHTVANNKGIGYVCNCCGCCCGMLRGITRWGVQDSVAFANYYAVVDEDKCTGCGLCAKRCQVYAITVPEEFAVVDRPRCLGCGVCVTRCPAEALELRLKPEDERVDPPEDFGDWQQQRLVNRGMTAK